MDLNNSKRNSNEKTIFRTSTHPPSNTRVLSVTHLNIRQSISFLLLRIILLEVFMNIFILLACFPLASIELRNLSTLISNQNAVFILLESLKLLLLIYVILEWLNEYYEINAKKIIHRKGILFRTEEDFNLDNVSLIGLDEGFFGRFLNYGTIKLYDKWMMKYNYLMIIHNPRRYYHLIKKLIPNVDEETHVLRDRIYTDPADEEEQ